MLQRSVRFDDPIGDDPAGSLPPHHRLRHATTGAAGGDRRPGVVVAPAHGASEAFRHRAGAGGQNPRAGGAGGAGASGGAPGSKARAVALYRKAAARGDAVAQYNLGYCNEAGLGLPVDARQAAAWYRKAANNTQDPVVQRMATSSLATLGGGTAAVAASATP